MTKVRKNKPQECFFGRFINCTGYGKSWRWRSCTAQICK